MIDSPSNAEGVEKSTQDVEWPVERLMRLAERARLFRSADGRLFARVPVEIRSEVYALKSGAFRDWLIGVYFHECHTLPPDGAVRRVISALEALARFGGRMPSVFVRVGRDGKREGSAYYIDLGDSSGQAVKIGGEGWEIVEKPGVDFWRPEGLMPLPSPSRDGSIELLRPYVNLTKNDFRLLVVWLAAAIWPVGPYPILALYGEQGSAKSTLARIVRLLIDPQAAPLLSEPRSIRDMMITAINGWLLAYDNIGVIPVWLSDGLCLLATGGGFAGRALFSNDQRIIIHAQRPVILNGTDEFVRRGDLSDRCVFLHLPPIVPRKRRREDEFWDAFYRDQPRILGGLLDAVVGGMRELPSIKLKELPRMADFAAFAVAVGRALGWKTTALLAGYNANRQDATATQIDDSPVGSAMLEYAPDRHWKGTASELLDELNEAVGKKMASSAGWPKSPAWLTNELRRIAPQLRIHNLHVAFERSRDKRILSIRNERGCRRR